MLRAATSSEFARYLTIGLVTFGVYCLLIFVCVELMGFYPSLAAGVAVAGSAIVNYWGHARFTFRSGAHVLHSLPRYVAVIAFNSMLAGAIVHVLTRFAGASIVSANAACLVLITTLNFFLLKRFVMSASLSDNR